MLRGSANPAVLAVCLFAMVFADRAVMAQSVGPRVAEPDLAGDSIPLGGVLRFGTTRFRTPSASTDVLFAGTSTLVTFCPDRFLVINEWPGGAARFRPLGMKDAIRALALNPSSGAMALAMANGSLSTFDLNTGKRQAFLGPVGYMTTALAISSDGKEIACGTDDGKVHVRALPEGTEARVRGSGTASIVSVVFANTMKVLSLDRDGKVQVWDGGSAKDALEFQVPVGSERLLVSRDASKVWVVGAADSASCWSLTDGKPVLSIKSDASETRCAALTPDGAVILTGGREGRVRAWNSSDGKELWSVSAHIGWVNGLTVAPDGKAVVSAGEDHVLRVFSTSNGADLAPSPGHVADVSCLALSPDGKVLATGGWDRTVRLWNSETSKQIQCFSELAGPVNALAWSPSGESVAVVAGKAVAVLEAKGEFKRSEFAPGASVLRSVAWCADGGLITGGTDTMVRLWNSSTGKATREFAGHTTMVTAIAASPDGQQFATAGTDSKSAIWNLATGAPLWLSDHPKAVSSVVFSADGHRVATGCQDGCIRLWDAQTGKAAGIIHGFDGTVTGVAFSPDGTLIAGAALYNSVRICEAPSGREFAMFRGPGGNLNGVCWTNDGKRVITALQDGTAIAWQVRK